MSFRCVEVFSFVSSFPQIYSEIAFPTSPQLGASRLTPVAPESVSPSPISNINLHNLLGFVDDAATTQTLKHSPLVGTLTVHCMPHRVENL